MKSAYTAKMRLSEATKPLLVVSRFVGMNPKSNWHKLYTVFILVFAFSYLCHFWRYYGATSNENNYFNVFVSALQDVCRTTSLFVILGSGLFDHKRFMIPLKEMENIDQSLERLGGWMDNKGAYRLQILLVIHIGLILLISGLVDFSLHILLLADSKLFIFVFVSWICNLAIIIVCTVADSCFASTLSIISKRFREINLIIHRLRNHGSYLRVNFLEVSRVHAGNDVLRDLRLLRKLYHDLWGIASRVNEAYGLHLLLGTMTSLALITSNLWRSYVSFSTSYPGNMHVCGESILWASFYVIRMFILVKASDLTVAEGRAGSRVLQELGMDDHDRATKREIRDFLTQVQLEVRKFTACGFFDIDSTLICGILGAAFTYLVILIQMDSPDACA